MSVIHRVFPLYTSLAFSRSLGKQTPQSLSPKRGQHDSFQDVQDWKMLGKCRLLKTRGKLQRGLGMGETENSKGNAGCEIYSRMKTIHKNLQEEAYKQ